MYKDTTNFLLKSKSVGNVPLGSLLVTLDVCSLYTNIPLENPLEEGVESCRELLDTRTIQEPLTEDNVKYMFHPSEGQLLLQ